MLLIVVLHLVLSSVVVQCEKREIDQSPKSQRSCFLNNNPVSCDDPLYKYVQSSESRRRCYLNEKEVPCNDPTYQKLTNGGQTSGKRCFIKGNKPISCDHELFRTAEKGKAPTFGVKYTNDGTECHINNKPSPCNQEIFEDYFKDKSVPTEQPPPSGSSQVDSNNSGDNAYRPNYSSNYPPPSEYHPPSYGNYPSNGYQQVNKPDNGYHNPFVNYPTTQRPQTTVYNQNYWPGYQGYNGQNVPSSQVIRTSTSSIVNRISNAQRQACGRVVSKSISPLISYGQVAKVGEFPWAAAIYDVTKQYLQICGGSILTPYTILSAAHCFFNQSNRTKRNAEDYMIAVGKVTRAYSTDDSTETQRYEVEQIFMESFFGVEANFVNDIAILVLKNEIRFSYYIGAVCLPLRGSVIRPGSLLNVFGWGYNENRTPATSLQTAQLPYFSYNDCIYSLADDNKRFLSSDKFCVKHVNNITLNEGDSGSGLTLQVENDPSHYIVGLVSFKETDIRSQVSVVTNVLNYDHFIVRVLKEIHQIKGFDISYLKL